MNLFLEKHQQLIQQLLLAKVDFIIIGGYSVIFHGYERITGDLDVWMKPDNNNKEKLLPALKYFQIDADEIKEISQMDFTKHVVVGIWKEPEKVDFITHINLVTYDEADKQKILAEWEGMKIPFLHLDHLVLSKINTGRIQDKADIEILQEIERKRQEKKK